MILHRCGAKPEFDHISFNFTIHQQHGQDQTRTVLMLR